ncbi:carbon-nitrogen hydrolase family protein [Rhodococcus fascians]|uniref:carbon-nitrogen hydrolase family protein n=1 Tax=Rhodococcoides fascians TaxID=1828 RepID=UPI001960DBB9|nr:carbon-nitrogen hydrolase family protein [Rhodococcus fascians]MBM7244434.1 carbon-nitrogen hydrolase family protein [Rhodococcus fascians]MBY3808040.1 carbon-nitrogen hydrolase family protein [Rhodococcus fascians]MBY3839588.1 carbon-nitrogen hydrolase family protein [Rhodococcus fascians]MBY3847851.1 carbon-nitrogen hydrolase family protein [Rhodococcus fascians]MBY3851357.1 carbon-nitrogen hydrolase family protein [Rhodococcus fascians]
MARVIRAAAVQAEPRWLDIEQGVDQVVDFIGQAAAGGARIVSFPEVFIPGYPWWIWLDAPAWGMQFVSRYIQNSMTRDGEHMTRIAQAAAANSIFVVLGFSERSGSTVYVSQAIIDASGEIVAVRRKLKPTHVERSVFGEGDGSDIAVYDTELGKIGALNCAENIQPLTKFAMFSMGEQIHVASWPSFSLYRGVAQALSAEVNNAASLTYAVEGQAFVLAPCAVVGRAGQDLFCDTDLKRQLLQCGGGFAQIYGPEGSTLTPPLAESEEGILFADLDFDMIDVAKHAFDPVGHYSRPDVFQLLFNPRKNEVVGAFDTTDPLVRRSMTDSALPVATDDGESD